MSMQLIINLVTFVFAIILHYSNISLGVECDIVPVVNVTQCQS